MAERHSTKMGITVRPDALPHIDVSALRLSPLPLPTVRLSAVHGSTQTETVANYHALLQTDLSALHTFAHKPPTVDPSMLYGPSLTQGASHAAVDTQASAPTVDPSVLPTPRNMALYRQSRAVKAESREATPIFDYLPSKKGGRS
jgi:hypothetical protein